MSNEQTQSVDDEVRAMLRKLEGFASGSADGYFMHSGGRVQLSQAREFYNRAGALAREAASLLRKTSVVMPGSVPADPDVTVDKDTELRMWLVVRTDIDIPRPKLAAQAGHGYAAALRKAQAMRWGTAAAYMSGSGQAKIVVAAKNEDALKRAFQECEAAGIPAVIVKDEGRTVFAEPTLTVVGIGPCLRDELPKYFQRLQLLKE